MEQLYPPIKPFATHQLAVDKIHTLHVEECGNPKGLPVLFLHGGPGAGCEPVHRRFFDPQRYRIVLFDQRGCGQSIPHAELHNNTTQHLIADIEQIRQRLAVERWVVAGGSWGSTLALAYGQAYPEYVLGMILRGIFLCRPRDIQWFYQEGANRLFPDAWDEYVAPIPESERDDLLGAYYRRLTGNDEVERLRVAKTWSTWEGTTLSLESNPHTIDHFSEAHRALSLARVEAHYFMHDSFLEPDQLLRDAHRLESIPAIIVHGRYDVICPLEGAWALHKAWPSSKLRIIPSAGHAATESGITGALVEAAQEIAARYP
jgi:proline iminopeptidase